MVGSNTEEGRKSRGRLKYGGRKRGQGDGKRGDKEEGKERREEGRRKMDILVGGSPYERAIYGKL